MKRLRTYYERELASLHGFTREYAEQYPAQADRLGIAAGGDSDPHIERFIQATALSNARTAQLIDDNDAKVTEALLNVNYPHYLQPFPSCAIVRIDADAAAATGAAGNTIARGAMLSCVTPGQPPCRFRTAFDVALTGVALVRAFFTPLIDAPPGALRSGAESAAFSFEIACAPGGPGLAEARTLRLFIDAEPSLCASARDMLFMRARSAYLEVPGLKTWIALDAVPLLPVGFAAAEALIPFGASSHVAYRLLTEFFAFPDKFNFVDIDLAALARRLPAACRSAILHLGLDLDPSRVAADAALAQRLAGLSARQFVAACTPIVNLFRRAACPIELDHTAPDYALMPDADAAHGVEIHSVDRVQVVDRQQVTEFRPYYSLRHGEAGGKSGRYYLLRRDAGRGRTGPGNPLRIALVDFDLDPLDVLDASVSVELTCTNGDLPSRLRYGASGSELHLEQVAGGFPLRLLRRPTPQRRFAPDAHWRLISHLSLNHGSLVQDGVDGLKEMLTLYDLAQSPVSRKQIDGIVALSQVPARAWLRDDGHASLVHGIELRLTLDEDAYAGAGLHLFVQVLAHFFGLYVHLNSFVQLTVISQASGKELYRCQPRNGARNLV